jgi:hypothetical protein
VKWWNEKKVSVEFYTNHKNKGKERGEKEVNDE